MTEINVSVETVNYKVAFAVQKRIDRNVTCKDVICFGQFTQLEDGGGGLKQLCSISEYAYALIPTVAYQSIKDSYDKKAGQKLSLERFLKRNNVPDEARKLIWHGFLKAYEPKPVKLCTCKNKGVSADSSCDKNTVDVFDGDDNY